MILVDSNIIIYSARPSLLQLREYFLLQQAAVSDLSRIEVLGYHRLTQADQHYFEAVFAGLTILPIDSAIINRAIMIRKAHNMKTADAIVAATAMQANCSLLTANTTDFMKVQGLALADMLISLA